MISNLAPKTRHVRESNAAESFLQNIKKFHEVEPFGLGKWNSELEPAHDLILHVIQHYPKGRLVPRPTNQFCHHIPHPMEASYFI